MEIKCSLLKTSDQKLWLFTRKANCTGGTGENNKTDAVDDDVVIAHPTMELWRHCLMRGANLGSFLCIVFGTPVLFYKGARQPAPLLQRLAGISTYGAVCRPTNVMS